MIEQLSVFLENRPGRLAEACRALGDARVNMRALMVADTEQFGVVRIICDRPHDGKVALETRGFSVQVTGVFAVEIPDDPGGLADVLETLGAAGMNVEYAYCFVEPGAAAAIDVLKIDDEGARAVLEVAGYRVLSPSDLYEPDAD
ncbi:MAG: ACT domain-containing protein [Clostridiales bacterium]|nr:ACT domain-containing protein [Clostridiales bacterium]